jgi:opacity protein-like surface antigen
MRTASGVLVLLLMPTLGTAGAARRPPAQSTTASRIDAFIGYSYAHAGEARLDGWQLDGSYRLRRSLRLVVDLSGHYGSFAQADLRQLTLLAGGRWTWPRTRPVAPFVEVLLGGVRAKTSVSAPGVSAHDSTTHWGAAVGAGVDYRISRRWAARGQVDLLLLRAAGSWENDPRFALGVVYRFGE